jgi:hypothetical protein
MDESARSASLGAGPAEGIRCRLCGCQNPADGKVCLGCGDLLAQSVEEAALEEVAGASTTEFHITATIMVLIVLALCVGIGWEAPGLGVGFAVLMTPVVIRTLVVSSDQRKRGAPTSLGQMALTGVGALMVLLLVGIASTATFVAVCFAGFMGGMALGSTRSRDYDAVQYGLILGLIAGAIAAITVAVLLFRQHWGKKKEH